MTQQVLFVQGGGARVHDDFDARLVASLRDALGPGYDMRYPRMPNEDDPRYDAWRTALEREFAALTDDAILVGHSVGGTILITALAEERPARKFGAIFLLAAPFVGDGGWQSDDLGPQRDLGAQLPAGVPIYLYHGLLDATAPPAHADLYARSIPQARLYRLPGRDHQFNNDLTEVAAMISSLRMPLTDPTPHQSDADVRTGA